MLQFSPWLGPQECPELWKITEPWNIKDDNELTAVQFIHQLTFHVWSEVLENWREVARASTSHVRTSVSYISSTPISSFLLLETNNFNKIVAEESI
jgi:hypothetical protein